MKDLASNPQFLTVTESGDINDSDLNIINRNDFFDVKLNPSLSDSQVKSNMEKSGEFFPVSKKSNTLNPDSKNIVLSFKLHNVSSKNTNTENSD